VKVGDGGGMTNSLKVVFEFTLSAGDNKCTKTWNVDNTL